MAIRQAFGKFIPSDVIRPLLAKPDCVRALLEVTSSWKFVRYEDGNLRWSRRWMNSPKKRWWAIAALNTLYFVSAGIAGLLFLAAARGMGSPTLWTGMIGLLFVAFFSLDISIDFSTASKNLPRHLGLS